MFKRIITTLFLISAVSNVMAYEIHISKTRQWHESDKFPIMPNEILEIVSSDPELIYEGAGVEGENPKTGEIIKISTDVSFKFIDVKSKQEYWFHLLGSHIRFKYIDDTQIQKAKEIAGKLKASVQGDEGEYY